MKTLIALTLTALACAVPSVYAQRVAYVDTRYILENIPEYTAAEKELELQTQQWQRELDEIRGSIERMYEKYRAEEVLLSDAQKKARQDEILAEEKRARDYQRKRFGVDGDLFKLRNEKVQPIQERIFAAIEEIARTQRYDMIFDKSGGVVVLYTNPDFDLSNLVLARLGIRK